MAMDTSIARNTGQELLSQAGQPELCIPYALALSQTLSYGTLVVSSLAAVNDVQTFTVTGTPTGGTVTYQLTNPLTGGLFPLTLLYNSTLAQAQAASDALIGTGNLTWSGGPFPGSTLIATGALTWAGMPIALATLLTNGLTGGTNPTSTIAHTTQGLLLGALSAYSGSLIAAPTTAATLADSATASTFLAGVHQVTYTFSNSVGETTPAPMAEVVLTTLHSISVTSITGIPTTVTSVNFYVDGILAVVNTPTAGATGTVVISGYSSTLTASPPRTNKARTGKFVGALRRDATSDANGVTWYGNTVGGLNGFFGGSTKVVPVYERGVFRLEDLIGVDAAFLDGANGYATIYAGSLASGSALIQIGN